MKNNNQLSENQALECLGINDIHIIQDNTKYKFTSDSIILGNYVSANKNAKMIDLCSGSGVVGILALNKNNCKHCTLVELQSDLANMSQQSINYNNQQDKFTVINDRLQQISEKVGKECFDVVSCNPPYKKNDGAQLSNNSCIDICKHEIEVNLEQIILESSKLLKFGGKLYICNKQDRLTDIICYCRKYNIEVKEIMIRQSNKFSNIIFVKAIKGGKSGVKLLMI